MSEPEKPTLLFSVQFGRLMRAYKNEDLVIYKDALERLKPYLQELVYDHFYNLSFVQSFKKKGY